MAHDNNGRIYIDTSGTTPVGISIADIQTVLGSSKNDIGALITAVDGNGRSIVNPHSKIKPVSINSPATPTDAQRKAINYGITAPVASSHPADTKNTAWSYTRPVGQPTDWFRFMDFNEYRHNATSPIVGRGDATISQSGGPVSLASFVNSVGSMTLQDYATLANYYLCVYMVGATTGLPYIKTVSQPFSSALSPSLTLEYSELPNQDFPSGTEYYLCLCDTMQTTLGGLPAGARYLPLPYFQGWSEGVFTGRITKQTGYNITFSFDLLIGGNSAPVASSFTNPAPPTPNYFSPLPSPDPYGVIENENRYYFNAGNNTSLKIRFKITGGTDTIYGNRIYAKLSPSYYGSPTARLKVDVYKVVNGTVSRISTSEALTQNTVYIGCLYSDVLVLNSNNQRAGSVPTTLTKIRPYLELFDGSGEDSVKIGGVTFGVCNQSF